MQCCLSVMLIHNRIMEDDQRMLFKRSVSALKTQHTKLKKSRNIHTQVLCHEGMKMLNSCPLLPRKLESSSMATRALRVRKSISKNSANCIAGGFDKQHTSAWKKKILNFQCNTQSGLFIFWKQDIDNINETNALGYVMNKTVKSGCGLPQSLARFYKTSDLVARTRSKTALPQ